MTQRDINQWAAPLELARRVLLLGPPARSAGESIVVYLHRFARPQSGETPDNYAHRMERSLKALQQAVSQTAAAHPKTAFLQDKSASNQQRWQTITRALSLLPARTARTQAVWEQARIDSMRRPMLGDELTATFDVMLRALDNLRDAHP